MIAADAKPRLAAKARLRFDRHSQQHMLVYPDRGMQLNASAAAILELCDGQRTVDDIVAALRERAGGATEEDVRRDVETFLGAMLERRLIQLEP
jgi:pyrroloquinoline quinone biosynthesis protein D